MKNSKVTYSLDEKGNESRAKHIAFKKKKSKLKATRKSRQSNHGKRR